jgi:hypothetical protein
MKREMKRDWLLQRMARITTTVLVAVVLLGSAPVVNAADEKPDDKWRFTLIPYFWLPSMSASIKLESPRNPASGSVDVGADTLLENLKFALPLSFQGQKGRWSLLFDFMYVKFGNDDEKAHFPGILVGAEMELESFVANFAVAYSVFRNGYFNFDPLVGVRYAVIDADVSLDIVRTPTDEISSRKFSKTERFIDPVIGFRGKFELGKNWYLPYYFDIGGFGIDSDLTVHAFAGIGYRFSKLFSMMLGYRYLYYDFSNTGLVKDLDVYGPILGFSFSF